jgi:hypothetical protein
METEDYKICIVCDKIVGKLNWEVGFPLGVTSGATEWRTSGNYGSQVIDCARSDFGADEIIAFICDECLQKKAHYVFLKKTETKKNIVYLGRLKEKLNDQDTEEVVES